MPMEERNVNPFPAPAHNISGIKSVHTRLRTVYFPVLSQIYFQYCPFYENHLQTNAKKKTKIVRISNFVLLVAVFN